jgi:hypothetical protein
MKLIVTTLVLCLFASIGYSQKKAPVKQKAKARTTATPKKKTVELLTEETYEMFLILGMDSMDDGKPISYTNAIEEEEVKAISNKVCNCFQNNFETIKKSTSPKVLNTIIEKCMGLEVGLEVAVAAKKLGKSLDDEIFSAAFGEKIGMQLLRNRCKPFLWLSMQQGLNEE